MRLCSLNVRGLRNRKKRLTVFRTLRKQNYDIILLQETYIDKTDIEQWTREWKGCIFAEPVTRHKMGNAILIKKKVEIDDLAYDCWSKRAQIISFTMNEQQ